MLDGYKTGHFPGILLKSYFSLIVNYWVAGGSLHCQKRYEMQQVTEILHELVLDTTRKSESHELIREVSQIPRYI